jgi:phage terminase large subunit
MVWTVCRRWKSSLKNCNEYFKHILGDIHKFANALGMRGKYEPTDQQKMLFDAVMRAQVGTGPRRIAVKSGQGPGKTTSTAVTGLYRALRYKDALTIVTAPTMRQCKEVWLAEARRIITRADPLLKRSINITKTKVELCKRPKWGVDLITASKPEAAQGIHEEHLTIIAEEASGIDRGIIENFEGTSTNDDSIFIMIGNPNTNDCAFFDCFNRFRHKWHCITFNAEDSPLVSKENIEYLAEKYGRDSDVYRVRVLGEFPHGDPSSVISLADAEACTRTDPEELRHTLRPDVEDHEDQYAHPQQFGIDYARFGSDESVIYAREGNAITDFKFYSHTDPNLVTREAFRMQIEKGWSDNNTWFIADAGGMGQGCMFNFYEADKLLHEFHNAGRPANGAEYDNKITEAWFELSHLMKNHQVHIPNDSILIQQLTSRKYLTTNKGKLIIETKDQYMKRDQPSPDRADALVMAFYEGQIARARVARQDPGKRIGVKR